VQYIKLEIINHIATITLDRPPVNAIHPLMLRELATALGGFADDRDVRVVILTATGTVFCAGADLKNTTPPPDISELSPTQILDPGRALREALISIHDCAVPVIGAVNGAAIGAGCGLAAMCDILVASETAQFGMTEVKVGLLGGAAHLTFLVGRRKAREMYLTGELISAHELHQLGMVRAVVAPGNLFNTARELADTIVKMSPIGVRLAKESFNRIEYLPFEEGYRIEQEYTARLRTFEDSSEAKRSWVERSEPEWKWR
jgi:enoyl-CoA hydratase